MPADVIIDIRNIGRVRSGEFHPAVFLDLLLELRQSPVVDEVFQSCDLAVFAVAEIALHLHDGFGNGDELVRRDESHLLCDRDERLFRRGRFAHPAPDEDVVTDDFSLFDDGEETHVLRVEVDAIVFRQRDRHLEFTGQVMRPIDWFVDWFPFGDIAGRPAVVGQPDFVIRRRFRLEMGRDAIGHRLHFVVNRIIPDRRGATHHIAVDVTARCESGQQRAIDARNGGLQIFLDHTMELKSLPRSNSERAIAVLFAEIEMIEELHEHLARPPLMLTTERLWSAYARVHSSQVKGADRKRQLSDLVSLLRFALGLDGELWPFTDEVDRRFQVWIFRHNAQRATAFTPEQTEWLRLMKEHIASSCSISRDDFDYAELADKGGLQKAWTLFGKELDGLMNEMNVELVA